MNYWLFKSEPTVFGIDHLAAVTDTIWDGIRNYQVRIYLRSMQVGDRCFFYHSNAEPMGIAGLAQVVATMVVDPTQFDPASDYFDEKSTPAEPRWHTVRIQFVEKFPQVLTLSTLQANFTPEELLVVRKGNRHSITPVSSEAATRILQMARHS